MTAAPKKRSAREREPAEPDQLPFEPVRRSLYRPDELYEGFDPARPQSWVDTADFRIYADFQARGGAVTADSYTAMLRSLHDASMTQLTARVIQDRKVVAVMGGHQLRRDDPVYASVAELARELAARDFLVTTGGGPGAMEATHLGASLAGEQPDRLGDALRALAVVPAMPDGLGRILDEDGRADGKLAKAAHEWFAPAFEVYASLDDPVRTLSVPTWHYGHEPSTPLATDIGKLFQNSIREDGLLAIATHGIVYAPGSAGTVQEIFQDAAQNYYESYGNRHSPMVLLGVDYWSATLPVVPVLSNLFGDRYEEIVKLTDDIEQAIRFLEEATPASSALGTSVPAAERRPRKY
jgi:predicted Rossmann-fold nucleotide-binding protein